MRITTALIALQLGLLLSASANAQIVQAQLSVSATIDPWRAGGYDNGSDGSAPPVFTFEARAGRALPFSSVTGQWSCNVNTPQFSPDGAPAGNNCAKPAGLYINNPTGPFSGYGTVNFNYGMAGVFLTDTLPTVAPPALYFYDKSVGPGFGLPTDFYSYSPAIGEVFFIGDGLTGTGAGRHQVFKVPATATRLYLGFVDTCTRPGGPGSPSCYNDNTGTLTASFAMYSIGH